MPRMNLKGSSSIVTGGASGIGAACARQLAEAGSKVVIADLNEEKGKEIAAEIVKQGGPKGLESKKIIALIAYLQRLGTDIKKAPPAAPSDQSVAHLTEEK